MLHEGRLTKIIKSDESPYNMSSFFQKLIYEGNVFELLGKLLKYVSKMTSFCNLGSGPSSVHDGFLPLRWKESIS